MSYIATPFSNAETFLQRARAFLEEKESLNNLILGLAMRLVEYPDWEDFPFSLTTIEDQAGNILAAALMTPPKHITIAGVESLHEPAVEALADSLIANHWRPPGIIGPKDLAETFAKIWTRKNGLVYYTSMNQRVYELRAVNAIPIARAAYAWP